MKNIIMIALCIILLLQAGIGYAKSYKSDGCVEYKGDDLYWNGSVPNDDLYNILIKKKVKNSDTLLKNCQCSGKPNEKKCIITFTGKVIRESATYDGFDPGEFHIKEILNIDNINRVEKIDKIK